MTLRKWPGPAITLVLVAVLGCSSSASAQPATAPPEIRPTWTPVLAPYGYDAYITQVCFNGNYVILAYADTRGGLSAAYGGRC